MERPLRPGLRVQILLPGIQKAGPVGGKPFLLSQTGPGWLAHAVTDSSPASQGSSLGLVLSTSPKKRGLTTHLRGHLWLIAALLGPEAGALQAACPPD